MLKSAQSQPRNGDGIQPTAQTVLKMTATDRAPAGRKNRAMMQIV